MNNKFTDKFFAFPVKVFEKDKFEDDPMLNKQAKDWVPGILRVPADCWEYATWSDHYSEGRTMDEIREEGFDCTSVYIPEYGEVICTWPRKKFEEKLNAFMEKQPAKEDNLVV